MSYDSTAKTATASTSREISLVLGNTRFSHRRQRCNTVTGIFLGDLSTLSHIRFLRLSSLRRLPPLEMTERDGVTVTITVFRKNSPSRPSSFRAVATCCIALSPKSLQLRGVEKSFLRTGIQFFPSEFRSCNTVTVICLRDFSTLSHIRFLRLQSTRRLPPLEMTKGGIESPSQVRCSGKMTLPSPRHFERCQHAL